ncbi:urea transporter [Alistipes sp.]|uniref:urea transporter n=1 Tax=Alistipes sp. TaxID=1872444 RepID=UPI003AF0450D
MANTITMSNGMNLLSFDFLKILLRGTGQVMFQNSAWTGLLFIIGIFWGAYAEGLGVVAWGALVGVIVSTITGYLIGFPARDGEQGLWGFNGVLVGCAFPTFLGNTIWMWLALILCAALTTWVRTGFNNVMAPWRVNSFTFPFVFTTWMFLLAARAMNGMPPTHMAVPALPEVFSSVENIRFGSLIVYWLKGVAQVFLIDSWVTGLLFLIGLALCSRWAALWAAIGSALALFVALIFKASGFEIAHGLYGFSAVLTAIALATVFYKPNRRSALWAILGILVTLFIQAGMNVLLEPVGLATLTGPFCIATWLFLLPHIQLDEQEKPDHSNWYPENKKHLRDQQPLIKMPAEQTADTSLAIVPGAEVKDETPGRKSDDSSENRRKESPKR